MNLSTDQVLALAPDPAAAKAGSKLADAANWSDLGQSPAALWGKCQGSALYQVRVDLSNTTASCSCPSRKFPCKHGLGLLLLTAQHPAAVPHTSPPPWVAQWLAKRESAQARRETNAQTPAGETAPADPAVAKRRTAQAVRTAAARERKVAGGLDLLDIWLNDLVRNGLAGLETRPLRFWEDQAARMVDAQAPGVAARVRALAALPGATPDWPDRLLAELGKLALLSEGYRALDGLDPALADDVRCLIGWTLREDEVVERGESVTDDWLVLGDRIGSEDRLRVRRTWLLGAQTRRTALVLQYATSATGFAESFVAGTHQPATVAYWPAASPQRALVRERSGRPKRWHGRLPGAGTIGDLLEAVADALARQPWLDRFACLLGDAVPVLRDGKWSVQDARGNALALAPGDHWTLLALSGGAPVDLAGEWDGHALRPFGVVVDGGYQPLPDDEVSGGTQRGKAGLAEPSALVAVALAGTAKAGSRAPASVTALDELYAGLPPRDTERVLLLRAAVDATQQLAGYLAQPGVALPAPAPDEQLAACSPALAGIVGDLLARQRVELLAEALHLLGQAHLRLPYQLLPTALSVHRDLREAMLPLLGQRGRWLSRAAGAWSWPGEMSLAGAGMPPDAEQIWQEGMPQARLSVLRRARTADPELARTWIEAVWKHEKAEFRAEMLALLDESPLADDEPLLEAALDDRAEAVRTRAVRMLARLPGSALDRRMRERVDALLDYEAPAPVGGLRGFVRNVLGGPGAAGVLRVRLPEELPKAWQRDGVSPNPPKGIGERSWWLLEALALIPPAHWETRWGLAPAPLIELAANSDEAAIVLEGWSRATVLHRAAGWASALWRFWSELKPESLPTGTNRAKLLADLLPALPPSEAEQQLIRAIERSDGSDGIAYAGVGVLPTPWSTGFGNRYVDAMRSNIPHRQGALWAGSLVYAARALPPACFERALTLETLGEPYFDTHYLKPFLATVKLRQRLYQVASSK